MAQWASIDPLIYSFVIGVSPIISFQILHPTEAAARGGAIVIHTRPVNRIIDSAAAHHYIKTLEILKLNRAIGRTLPHMIVDTQPILIIIEIQQQTKACDFI